MKSFQTISVAPFFVHNLFVQNAAADGGLKMIVAERALHTAEHGQSILLPHHVERRTCLKPCKPLTGRVRKPRFSLHVPNRIKLFVQMDIYATGCMLSEIRFKDYLGRIALISIFLAVKFATPMDSQTVFFCSSLSPVSSPFSDPY
jgi:hypothetical protein